MPGVTTSSAHSESAQTPTRPPARTPRPRCILPSGVSAETITANGQETDYASAYAIGSDGEARRLGRQCIRATRRRSAGYRPRGLPGPSSRSFQRCTGTGDPARRHHSGEDRGRHLRRLPAEHRRHPLRLGGNAGGELASGSPTDCIPAPTRSSFQRVSPRRRSRQVRTTATPSAPMAA